MLVPFSSSMDESKPDDARRQDALSRQGLSGATSNGCQMAWPFAGHDEGVGDVLQVTPRCAIPLDEIEWRVDASGGPGGQHANRARTRVEATFSIASSPSLSDADRARLRSRLGDVVRAAAADERSQARNRALALERLRARLADALRDERPRRPTRPTRGSRERRLAGKRRRSEVKRLRRRSSPDE
jgi:ribosome-associated protein